MASSAARTLLSSPRVVISSFSRPARRCQFPSSTAALNPIARSQIARCYSSHAKTAPAEETSGSRLQAPDHLDEKERHIFEKLLKELGPSRLEVQDVSGGCGSMYAIEIASKKFKGLTMVKQHRLVNDILGEEIKGWHGMQLRTKAE
ncbi:hypothetical protein RUND412_000544 [Rhizina undulata]